MKVKYLVSVVVVALLVITFSQLGSQSTSETELEINQSGNSEELVKERKEAMSNHSPTKQNQQITPLGLESENPGGMPPTMGALSQGDILEMFNQMGLELPAQLDMQIFQYLTNLNADLLVRTLQDVSDIHVDQYVSGFLSMPQTEVSIFVNQIFSTGQSTADENKFKLLTIKALESNPYNYQLTGINCSNQQCYIVLTTTTKIDNTSYPNKSNPMDLNGVEVIEILGNKDLCGYFKSEKPKLVKNCSKQTLGRVNDSINNSIDDFVFYNMYQLNFENSNEVMSAFELDLNLKFLDGDELLSQLIMTAEERIKEFNQALIDNKPTPSLDDNAGFENMAYAPTIESIECEKSSCSVVIENGVSILEEGRFNAVRFDDICSQIIYGDVSIGLNKIAAHNCQLVR